MEYTVKEAAVLLGLTKTGVVYHLRMMGDPLEKDAKGRIIVTESAIDKMRDAIETAKCKAQSDNSAQSVGANSAKTSRKQDLSEILLTQLNKKDSEIEKLHEEIAKLHEELSGKQRTIDSLSGALTAAQALHAATTKELQEVKQEAKKEREAQTVEAEPEATIQPKSETTEDEDKSDSDTPTVADEANKQESTVPEPEGKRSWFARLFKRR